MIETKELSKHYGLGKLTVKAVDKVSLSVHEREFVVVMGRSGCGKSTLLSLIGGLTQPTSGSVAVKNVDIWSLNDLQRSRFRGETVGFVFQFPSLIPTLSVLDNVRLPSKFTTPKSDTVVAAKKLLEKAGLGERIDAYPSQLSGGEQRRVGIARALMNNPNLILADEPTGDLDEATEREIMSLIREIHETGTTILLVTHNPELGKYAGRRLIMTSGTIAEG